MSLDDISELKTLKAYIIRSEVLNRTYTVFVDPEENRFMYCLVEFGSDRQLLVNKESLDDVLYEIRLHGTDICDQFEAVIKDIVDVMLSK